MQKAAIGITSHFLVAYLYQDDMNVYWITAHASIRRYQILPKVNVAFVSNVY